KGRRGCWAAGSSRAPSRWPTRPARGPSRRPRPPCCAPDVIVSSRARRREVGSGKTMKPDLDKQTIEKAYARWAPVYDLVFDKVMAAGRRAAVAAARQAGTRILDVGVGTGLELPLFDPGSTVVGV